MIADFETSDTQCVPLACECSTTRTGYWAYMLYVMPQLVEPEVMGLGQLVW